MVLPSVLVMFCGCADCLVFVQDTLGRFAIRWLLHSLMWGLGGSMDAKGRAELGELLLHHSGLAPPVDGADLTSLQVRLSLLTTKVSLPS